MAKVGTSLCPWCLPIKGGHFTAVTLDPGLGSVTTAYDECGGRDIE